LNNNGNNTIENDVPGSDMVPIESLKGLKRMLLITCTSNNDNNNYTGKSVDAAANGALYFALDQQLHPTTTEERRNILHDIAKAAFIACPRAVLSQIVDISSGMTEHAHLQRPTLQFVEQHLLVPVQDQDDDIKESLLSFQKLEDELIMAEDQEKQEKEYWQMMVLLAALKKKDSVVGVSDKGNDGFSTWAVRLLKSLLQHSRSLEPPATALKDGLKSIIETLSPRRLSPPGTVAAGGGKSSKRRRSSGSPSPRPTTHTTTRGKERGASYSGGKNKYTPPPLPPSGSSRPPRSSPPSATTRRERGSSAHLPSLGARGGKSSSKWSSRGPTPALEEGELGDLDEGELPPSQKQQSRRSWSPGKVDDRGDRGGRERGGDRIERERRRGSPSPLPPSYSYRRDDQERGGRGGDRGEYRGGDRLPPRDRDRDGDMRRLPPPSNQKVSGRGMPPLKYAGKALWVGQVPRGPSAERELVDAFSSYGQLTSHHIIARSSCAFFNYVDVECAIEAREMLDGARVAGSTLVVEFKGEKKYWESRAGRERDRERERGNGGGGGGDYRGDRERDRDRDEFERGDEYVRQRQSPLTGGGGVPPLPPQRGGGGSRSRSRTRSPGGGGRRRRNSVDHDAGRGDGGWHSNQPGRVYSMMSQEQLPSLPLPHTSLEKLPFTGMKPSPTPATAPGISGGGGGGAPGSIVWQGSLGKSRQPQAEVACLHSSHHHTISSSGWAAAEPAGWPAMLDVQNRISTAYVLNTLIPTLPSAERAVLQLIPAPGRESTEAARLQAFSSYLQGKQRTGVVELGPGPQLGAPRLRVLYLIPASEEACRAVGMGSLSGDGGEFMFAVVAAKNDESGGMQ